MKYQSSAKSASVQRMSLKFWIYACSFLLPSCHLWSRSCSIQYQVRCYRRQSCNGSLHFEDESACRMKPQPLRAHAPRTSTSIQYRPWNLGATAFHPLSARRLHPKDLLKRPPFSSRNKNGDMRRPCPTPLVLSNELDSLWYNPAPDLASP